MQDHSMLKWLGKSYLLLFISFFIIFLFTGYKSSMVANKYLSEWGMKDLFNNYRLFSTNFYSFVTNTISPHEGDTESGWRSFYYLFPLFLFLKMLGSLNLQNLYFFNFVVSIISLILFYKVCDKYLGKEVANISTFFLTFSSWFSEFAMSFSYHAPTILIALLLIYLMFDCLNKPRAGNYFLLGAITGVSLYFYGVVRFLLPVVLILLFINRKEHFYNRLICFLSGFLPLLILSFLLSSNYPIRFFDQENIFYTEPGYSKFLFFRWFDNSKFFLRALGGKYIKPWHASLINKILIIPLIVGFGHLLRKSKTESYRLLLVIATAIMLLPVFTTSFHWQPRRFVLYVIPVYAIIGIGGFCIIKNVNFIRWKKLRAGVYCFIVFLSIYVVGYDIAYTRNNIWSGKRDKGFVKLGVRIKEFFIEGPILYLREVPHRLYEVDCEATILTLILNDKNHNYKVENITNLDSMGSISNEAYIVKSPFIDKESFLKMGEGESLFFKLILSVPYNGGPQAIDDVFRLYYIKKS